VRHAARFGVCGGHRPVDEVGPAVARRLAPYQRLALAAALTACTGGAAALCGDGDILTRARAGGFGRRAAKGAMGAQCSFRCPRLGLAWCDGTRQDAARAARLRRRGSWQLPSAVKSRAGGDGQSVARNALR
jgi:hypothetical protein